MELFFNGCIIVLDDLSWIWIKYFNIFTFRFVHFWDKDEALLKKILYPIDTNMYFFQFSKEISIDKNKLTWLFSFSWKMLLEEVAYKKKLNLVNLAKAWEVV